MRACSSLTKVNVVGRTVKILYCGSVIASTVLKHDHCVVVARGYIHASRLGAGALLSYVYIGVIYRSIATQGHCGRVCDSILANNHSVVVANLINIDQIVVVCGRGYIQARCCGQIGLSMS